MFFKHKLTIAVAAVLALPTVALAEAPKPLTNAPYIVLSDNLDEPNGYGFCFDTMSRGKTDLAHSHTCKPPEEGVAPENQDNDVRFEYKADTKQVASFTFKGVCMQALTAANRDTVFALLECDDDAPRQKFVYTADDQTLRLDEDQTLCVGVVATTATAGPWVSRGLVLESCDDLDDSRKQWTVAAQ